MNKSFLISAGSSTPLVHLAHFTATPTLVGSGSKVNYVFGELLHTDE